MALGFTRHLQDESGRQIGIPGYRREIKRKRAKEAPRRVATLQTLAEIDREIIATMEPQGILDLVCHRAAELVRAPKAIMSIEESSGKMGVVSSHGLDDTERVRTNEKFAGLWQAGVFRYGVLHARGAFGLNDIPADDPRLAEFCSCENTHAVMVAPLVTGGQVLGALMVLDTTPHTWSADEIRLLNLLASQAAAALDKARLLEAERCRALHLATLNEIGQAIISTLDLDTMLVALLERVRQASDAEVGSVALVDADTGDPSTLPSVAGPALVFRQAVGEAAQAMLGSRLKPGQGIAGWVAAHRQSALVADVASDPRFYKSVDSHTGFTMRDLVCVPLIVRDAVTGVIELINKRNGRLGEDDVRLLESVAAQAAIAIENAQLYSSLQETNSQLRVALRAKNEMLQNVSHELCTPLGVIYGYTEMLENTDLGPLTSKQKQAVQIIRRHSDRLHFMVDRLLALQIFRTDEFGRIQLDLGTELRRVVQEWETRAAETGIELRLEIAASLPQLRVNPNFMRQVVGNLLDNAIKFSPDGGLVQVRAGAEEDRVIIAVSDEGIGIPPDKLQHVSELFYQVDGGPARRFGGMGIGLALCRTIVEAHGGQITVTSQVGAGTTFTIRLPVGGA